VVERGGDFRHPFFTKHKKNCKMFGKFKIPLKVIFNFKQLSFLLSILPLKRRETKKVSNDAVYRPEKMQPQKTAKTLNKKKLKKSKRKK
jgi:hypothetical protein